MPALKSGDITPEQASHQMRLLCLRSQLEDINQLGRMDRSWRVTYLSRWLVQDAVSRKHISMARRDLWDRKVLHMPNGSLPKMKWNDNVETVKMENKKRKMDEIEGSVCKKGNHTALLEMSKPQIELTHRPKAKS